MILARESLPQLPKMSRDLEMFLFMENQFLQKLYQKESVARRAEMEKETSLLKGLFNDLNRTLLFSAILLDDLHLQLQQDSELYDSWWLANQQLNRAIEFFLELRSTCFWFLSSVDLRNKGNGDGRFLEPQDRKKISEAFNIIIDSCHKLLGKGKGRVPVREVKRVLKVAEEASKFKKMAI